MARGRPKKATARQAAIQAARQAEEQATHQAEDDPTFTAKLTDALGDADKRMLFDINAHKTTPVIEFVSEHWATLKGIGDIKLVNPGISVKVSDSAFCNTIEALELEYYHTQRANKVGHHRLCLSVFHTKIDTSSTIRGLLAVDEVDFTRQNTIDCAMIKTTMNEIFNASQPINRTCVLDCNSSYDPISDLYGKWEVSKLPSYFDQVQSSCFGYGFHSAWKLYNVKYNISGLYTGECGSCTIYKHDAGDPVLFIITDESQYDSMITLMNNIYNGDQNCNGEIFHNHCFVHPNILTEAKIEWHFRLLKEGEFIIFGPRVFQCFVSLGTNVMESRNFLPEPSIPYLLVADVDICNKQIAPTDTFFVNAFPLIKRYKGDWYEAYISGKLDFPHPVTGVMTTAMYGPLKNVEDALSQFDERMKAWNDRLMIILTVIANFAAASSKHHNQFADRVIHIINLLPKVKELYKSRFIIQALSICCSLVEQSYDLVAGKEKKQVAVDMAVFAMLATKSIDTETPREICPIHYLACRFLSEYFAHRDVSAPNRKYVFELVRLLPFSDKLYVDTHSRGTLENSLARLRSDNVMRVSMAVWELLNRILDNVFGLRQEFEATILNDDTGCGLAEEIRKLADSKNAKDSKMEDYFNILSSHVLSLRVKAGKSNDFSGADKKTVNEQDDTLAKLKRKYNNFQTPRDYDGERVTTDPEPSNPGGLAPISMAGLSMFRDTLLTGSDGNHSLRDRTPALYLSEPSEEQDVLPELFGDSSPEEDSDIEDATGRVSIVETTPEPAKPKKKKAKIDSGNVPVSQAVAVASASTLMSVASTSQTAYNPHEDPELQIRISRNYIKLRDDGKYVYIHRTKWKNPNTMIYVDNNVQYYCEGCNGTFDKKSAWRHHTVDNCAEVKDPLPFKCHLCNIGFKYESSYKRHLGTLIHKPNIVTE